MKKKLISLLTSMAMIAILLTGCGSTPDTAADSDAAAKPQSEETPKAGQPDDKADTKSAQEGSSDVHNDLDYDAANKTYAFVFKATGNPNGEKQMDGFKKVIEAYGGNVILKSPEAATVEGQITIVNELIQQKVDCICLLYTSRCV